MNKRIAWKRIWGPVVSVALHAGVVVLLLHTLGFTSREKPEPLRIELAEPLDLTLDEVLPLDPPERTDEQAPAPEPLSTAEIESLSPPDEVLSEVVDDTISILDNLSPLILQGIGADLSSQGTLASRYGKRALKNGLLGSYFNRIDFTGETFMRIDETLNYSWELESPWPGKVRPERFSIIWTGRIVPPRTGEYTFHLQSDDGARLWIDGQLVLDQFVERERQVDEVKIRMLVGKSYDIKYAFCDVYHHAVSRLEWSCEAAGIPRQLIPTEHLWADGASTRQMIAWNEEAQAGAGARYPNRNLMRNPAMIEGQPFSHVVGYQSLNRDGLVRLGLEELADDLAAYQKSGRLPSMAQLPAMPPGTALESAAPRSRSGDVRVEIQ